MMKPEDFLRQVSSQAKADNPVPTNRFGTIDFAFDTSTYPQVKPQVEFDGQGLSTIGYKCLSTYTPVAGDRVLLVPIGTTYVIAGSVNGANGNTIYPGQLVFDTNNHSSGQTFVKGDPINWSDSLLFDPYNFWDDQEPSYVTPTIPGWYRVTASISFPTPPGGYREIEFQNTGSTMRSGIARAADMTGGHVRIHHSVANHFDGIAEDLRVLYTVSGTVPSPAPTFPTGGNASQLQMYYVGPPTGYGETLS